MAEHSPSPSLLAVLEQELARHPPFAQMLREHRLAFAAAATLAYYAPDEQVLGPEDGPVTQLYWVRSGAITGRKGLAELSHGAFEYAAGDLFPVGAVVAGRAVSATYTAHEDTFCLCLPAAQLQALAQQSPPLAAFLSGRVMQFVQLSQRAAQAAYSSATMAEVSLQTPLAQLPAKAPLACQAHTPLQQALTQMHERGVGSILVLDAAGAAQGIFTRHDVLSRVALPQLPLHTPVSQVMSAPLHTLTLAHTTGDAALLMGRHGLRHVPVTNDSGRVLSIVSERDLFAMQQLSLAQVGNAIRAAGGVPALQAAAGQIRRLARHLLAQGVQARQTTELISHLNDLLTERLVVLLAAEQRLDLQQMCWLSFGSEGRSEQTIATDQDNGLIFHSPQPDAERPRWLALAEQVNEALAACGYPLCKGNVMARNPQCCLSADEWQARFSHWVGHGAPQDLLNASIYFDLRGLAGRSDWVAPLHAHVAALAQAAPRFLHQMAANALRQRAPLNWRGAVDATLVDGRAMLDLKLHGTALFVDVARLYALAHGVQAVNTRARFEAVAALLGAQPAESEAWVTAFEFLQMLRLRLQLEPGHAARDNPNLLALDTLNDIDRRVLRESLRVARRLQQRILLDWPA